MIFKHCPNCGEKLDKKEIGDEGLVPFCVSCNAPWFSFSYPCVLCLVVDENENVVLARDMANTYYGGVAGYIKEGEAVEDAAKREIEEEIGIEVLEIKYIKSYSRDQNTLMLCFFCKAKNQELKISEKELHSAGWFPINEARNLVRQGSIIMQLIDDYKKIQSENGGNPTTACGRFPSPDRLA